MRETARKKAAAALAAAVFVSCGTGQEPPDERNAEFRKPTEEQTLSSWHPTPEEVSRTALRMAGTRAGDVVYDVGAGDGRVLERAVRDHDVRGVGIEIHEGLVEAARRRVAHAGLADRIEIRHEDAMEAEYPEATVVFTYLTGTGMEMLSPKLLERLEPGTRVVTHGAPLTGLRAAGAPVILEDVEGSAERHVLTLYVIPERERETAPDAR